MSTNPDAILAAIDARLPRRVRWTVCGTPLDFDFSAERFRLRRPDDRDIVGGPIPEEWLGFRLIGRYFCDGGASPWIAIRDSDGFVCGLDIERDSETTFIFNSSLDRFISTFNMLDEYLRTGRELSAEVTSRVGALDPDVFARSDWHELIEVPTAG